VEVDSSTSVIPTELAEGTEDPRPPMPEFLRFLEQVSGWVYGPPVIEHLDVVRWLYTCSEPSARNPPFDRKGDLGKGRALEGIRNAWIRRADTRRILLDPRFLHVGLGVVHVDGFFWVTLQAFD